MPIFLWISCDILYRFFCTSSVYCSTDSYCSCNNDKVYSSSILYWISFTIVLQRMAEKLWFTWGTVSSHSCRSDCSSPGRSSPCTKWVMPQPQHDSGFHDTIFKWLRERHYSNRDQLCIIQVMVCGFVTFCPLFTFLAMDCEMINVSHSSSNNVNNNCQNLLTS